MMLKQMILRLYFIGRAPFLYLLKLCVRCPSAKPAKISRALLIRLDRMGDLVLSLPVIDNLKAAYPDAKIDMLVRPYLKGLAGLIKGVDKVLEYDGLISAAQKARAGNYDLVIDMLYDYKLKPAFIALLSGAPVRIGFAWGFRELLFTDPVMPVKDASMVALDLELLKPLNVPIKVSIPILDIAKVPAPGRMVIGLHPGGYYRSQRWAPERFAILAKKIREKHGVDIVVIGGPGEKALVDRIVTEAGNNGIKGKVTDMKELVAALSGCSLLICNNSGPLHLASAIGVPTVSIMGPTDPILWWPQGDKNIVIRKDLACSPCLLPVCRSHACMDYISVDEVCREVGKALERFYG